MVVKAHRALMTKNLVFASGVASKAILFALTKQFPKMMIGISEHQLTDNKDAMNHQIAEKVCSERVTNNLSKPHELATKTFLLLIRHIIKAYIDPGTTPSTRMFSAWYLAFFCRMWKDHLKNSSTSEEANTQKPSLGNNFISANLHTCIEIDGQHLLLFHNQCRDMKKPELFIPSLAGSQPCEDKFRNYRSMSTRRSTIINFDIKDLCQKSKRLRMLDTIAATTEDFTFPSKRQADFFIPETLMSDEEINNVVKQGFTGATKDLEGLGESPLHILCENIL